MYLNFETFLAEQRERIWSVIEACLKDYRDADTEVLRWMGQEAYLPLLDNHWKVVEDYLTYNCIQNSITQRNAAHPRRCGNDYGGCHAGE